MTIHSSKGLEFPTVVLTGLEEGLFPLGTSAFELEELEEERRLFYVALTRARYKVYLSFANARRRFGGAPVATTQSRFIHEIPNELIDFARASSPKYSMGNMSSLPKPQIVPNKKSNYTKGNIVEHKMFGRGKVLAIEGEGEMSKLTILFNGNIRKKLIAKYANLTQLQ